MGAIKLVKKQDIRQGYAANPNYRN
jgi:hypothetical protein